MAILYEKRKDKKINTRGRQDKKVGILVQIVNDQSQNQNIRLRKEKQFNYGQEEQETHSSCQRQVFN